MDRRAPLTSLPCDPRSRPADQVLVSLEPSAQIQAFRAAAAQAGLPIADAVRLAIERELALRDAGAAGLGREACRHLLGGAASSARPRHPLGPAQAGYVRALTLARPLAAPPVGCGIDVAVPERLLTRSGGTVPTSAFHPPALAEAIAWEIAATFDGRTLGEWALATLAARAHAHRT